MQSEQLLFIYGTLRRGGSAHYMMADAKYVSAGTIKGRLVHVNQYPGLIRDSESIVKGELYLVSADLVVNLDQYEGCNEFPPLYISKKIEVLLDSGEKLSAATYVFQQLKKHHEEIECGDWIEWCERKKS